MTRECIVLLSIIMISPYDDLTGREEEVQNFLKMIKEKNIDDQTLENMLEKMTPREKVQKFLNERIAILMEADKQGFI